MKQKKITGKTESVCEAIKNVIYEQQLTTGTKLGSERLLAEQLGVHRLTVRKAIKKLCQNGILIQKPYKGTFVAKKIQQHQPPPMTSPAMLAPVGSFFFIPKQQTIRFSTDDALPQQKETWLHLFRQFEKKHPHITIKPEFESPSQSSLKTCDIYTVASNSFTGFIPTNHEFGNFPVSWTTSTLKRLKLPLMLQAKLSTFITNTSTYQMIPIMAQAPLILCNQNLLKEHATTFPAYSTSLATLEIWLQETEKSLANLPLFPFLQSPLNHYCRQNKGVLPTNNREISIDFPECRHLLRLQKKLIQQAITMVRTKALNNIFSSFIKGQIPIIELFSNLFPYIKHHFTGDQQDLILHPSPLSTQGITQIMFRGVALGNQIDKKPYAIEFINYLTQHEAQSIIADEKFGIPIYLNAPEHAFCNNLNLSTTSLKQEISRATGLFSSPFFCSSFQHQILESNIMLYINNHQSEDETITQISKQSQALTATDNFLI